MKNLHKKILRFTSHFFCIFWENIRCAACAQKNSVRTITRNALPFIFGVIFLGIFVESVCAVFFPTHSIVISLILTRQRTAALARTEEFLKKSGPVPGDAYIALISANNGLTATLTTDMPSQDPFRRMYDLSFTPKPHLSLVPRVHDAHSLIDLLNYTEYRVDRTFYILDKPYDAIATEPMDDILLKGLYCDRTGFTPIDYGILTLAQDRIGGYLDTHHLITLLLLRHNRCGDSALIATAITTVAERIRAACAQTGTHTSNPDLFAEQLAVLTWAGRTDLIDPRWLIELTQMQSQNGSWSHATDKNPNIHTTALAYAVLRASAGFSSIPEALQP